MKLTIGYLYGDLMNIYGDTGNITALKKRAEWRNIDVSVINLSIKDNIEKAGADLYFFGGGQDHSQETVCQDLTCTGKGIFLKEEITRDVPLLAICGGYQLLGDYYQPHQGPKMTGISIFPAYTVAGERRMIGNIICESNIEYRMSEDQPENSASRLTINENRYANLLVGFENHSGKTYLTDGAKPLGKVVKGFGNNGEDSTEGCVYKNAVGCYMHGSLLPKNPQLADWFLSKALEVKYQKKITLKPLDDTLENQAHDYAISKFS